MENKNLGNGYEIKYVMDSFNNTLAELVINGLPQCVSFTDNRKYLLYDKYSYYYDTPCIIDKIKSTLVLGGGAFTYPKYYISKYIDKYMDVVELNETLIKEAYKAFYLNDLYQDYDPERKRLNIINDDCINYIFFKCNKKYDYIFFDAYIGYNIVPNIYENETIQRLKSLLNENGYLAINYVIQDENKHIELVKVLKQYFKYIIEYGIEEDKRFRYILMSDKKIKNEDVISR